MSAPDAVSYQRYLDSRDARASLSFAEWTTALAHAQAEVIQARLERDRLGIDIGSVPPVAQQENYRAALAKLRALN